MTRGERRAGEARGRHRRAQPRATWPAFPNGCRRSARWGSIRSWCSSTPATKCCSSRYADTRRRHPLSQLGLALADAIALRTPGAASRCAQIADVVHRHQRPQRAPAAPAGDHRVRPRRRLARCRCCSNPSPTAAACRPTPTSCSTRACLPNPHWDAAPAPAVGPRRRRARVPRRAAGRRRSTSSQISAVPRHLAAAPAVGHPQLRHRRVRLHRRPPPLGVPGRTPGRALRASSGWAEVAVHHRELD